MAPADKRLGAYDPAGRDVDQRLIVNDHLAEIDASLQHVLEPHPLQRADIY